MNADDELRDGLYFGLRVAEAVYVDDSTPLEKATEPYYLLPRIASGETTLVNSPAETRRRFEELADRLEAEGIDPTNVRQLLNSLDARVGDRIQTDRELAQRIQGLTVK